MDIREEIIAKAKSVINTTENPKGTNKTDFGKWFGMNGVAWCAIWVSWVYAECKKQLAGDIEKPKNKVTGETWPGFYYVPSLLRWARKNNKITKDPKPGDIFIIDFQADGLHDHTGIFEGWANAMHTKFNTIEGNTSSDHQGSQDNGDGVYPRIRNNKNVIFINVLD